MGDEHGECVEDDEPADEQRDHPEGGDERRELVDELPERPGALVAERHASHRLDALGEAGGEGVDELLLGDAVRRRHRDPVELAGLTQESLRLGGGEQQGGGSGEVVDLTERGDPRNRELFDTGGDVDPKSVTGGDGVVGGGAAIHHHGARGRGGTLHELPVVQLR